MAHQINLIIGFILNNAPCLAFALLLLLILLCPTAVWWGCVGWINDSIIPFSRFRSCWFCALSNKKRHKNTANKWCDYTGIKLKQGYRATHTIIPPIKRRLIYFVQRWRFAYLWTQGFLPTLSCWFVEMTEMVDVGEEDGDKVKPSLFTPENYLVNNIINGSSVLIRSLFIVSINTH